MGGAGCPGGAVARLQAPPCSTYGGGAAATGDGEDYDADAPANESMSNLVSKVRDALRS